MPNTADETAELTDAAAEGPAAASVGGRSAQQHRLADLIALEKWRANQAAASSTSGGIGIKFFETSPPGTV